MIALAIVVILAVCVWITTNYKEPPDDQDR